MMNRKNLAHRLARLALVSSLTLVSACELLVMRPDAATDPLSVFDEYARLVTEKWALEAVKGVDMQALIVEARADVSDNSSPRELYDAMNTLALAMQEPHTKIRAPDVLGEPGDIYDRTAGYPKAYSFGVDDLYYTADVNPDSATFEPDSSFTNRYGTFVDQPSIGFVRISAFVVVPSDETMDDMMATFVDTDGVVLDVRANLGGSRTAASKIAAYFTDRDVEFGTDWLKTGPGENDYTPTNMVLAASGTENAYTDKPVIILQDRIAFSSGSLFTLMLRSLPHVTTLGVTDGGGTGEIMDGYLANGWLWKMSTSNLIGLDGKPTDNGGEPDIHVEIDEDLASERDTVIERAWQEILDG